MALYVFRRKVSILFNISLALPQFSIDQFIYLLFIKFN